MRARRPRSRSVVFAPLGKNRGTVHQRRSVFRREGWETRWVVGAATTVCEEKRKLRCRMRELLEATPPQERVQRSQAACDAVASTKAFEEAVVVMLYLSLPDEVDTTPLALRAYQLGKTVCAPRVDWERKRLTPVELSAFDLARCQVRRFGVREPAEDARPVPLSEIDLVLTPGLAFDEQGWRLGRGEGFYDRFLARPELARADVFGLCFDFQLIPLVPRSDHDVQMDVVTTDRRVVGPCRR